MKAIPTLIQLLTFEPINDNEKKIFNFDNFFINEMTSKISKNMFYLGGQVKMTSDDPISLSSINLVREITNQRELEYGGACNSFEYISILYSKKQLDTIEQMILAYNKIIEMREKIK